MHFDHNMRDMLAQIVRQKMDYDYKKNDTYLLIIFPAALILVRHISLGQFSRFGLVFAASAALRLSDHPSHSSCPYGPSYPSYRPSSPWI